MNVYNFRKLLNIKILERVITPTQWKRVYKLLIPLIFFLTLYGVCISEVIYLKNI